MRAKSGFVFSLLILAAPVLAQPVVDGTIAGDDYGDAAAVQAVQTQFGDNFSEWNAAYCTIQNGRLYLALTGNLEANFNKLEIIIDSVAGGENVWSGVPGNDGAGAMTGFTMDAGFEADYHLIARRGFDGSINRFDLDISALGTANFDGYFDVFAGADFGAGSTGTGVVNGSPIDIAYNGSNAAGVGGGCDPADQAAALAVETGLELSIALADIGNPSGDIKVMVFQNNQAHDYASNQFLGSLTPPQCNLGSDGTGAGLGFFNVDFNTFAGDQFFTCAAHPSGVPTVSEWGLMVMALITFSVGTVHYNRSRKAALAVR